jgi:hypothetical protein
VVGELMLPARHQNHNASDPYRHNS